MDMNPTYVALSYFAGIFAVFTLITSAMADLHEIAEQSVHITLEQTKNMQEALPCAFEGIPLEMCVPTYNNTIIIQDLQSTQNNIEQIRAQFE